MEDTQDTPGTIKIKFRVSVATPDAGYAKWSTENPKVYEVPADVAEDFISRGLAFRAKDPAPPRVKAPCKKCGSKKTNA